MWAGGQPQKDLQENGLSSLMQNPPAAGLNLSTISRHLLYKGLNSISKKTSRILQYEQNCDEPVISPFAFNKEGIADRSKAPFLHIL